MPRQDNNLAPTKAPLSLVPVDIEKGLLELMGEHVIIVITDPVGHFKYINDNFCKLSQYSEAELQGKDYTLLKSNKHPESFWDELWQTISTGQTWTGNICHQAKDNSLFWLDTRIKPVRNEEGAISSYIAIQTDITSYKIAEANFESAQHTLNEAARLAHIGSWEYSAESDQLYWSETIKNIHEVPKDFEVTLEKAVAFYKEGSSRDAVSRAIERAIEDCESFDIEVEIVTARGNSCWVRSIGQAEFQNGACVRLYGVIQDINREKIELSEHKETSALLNTVLDAATEYSFVSTDCDGLITFFNKGSEKMYGYSKEEVVGKVTASALHDPEAVSKRAETLSKLYNEPVDISAVFTKIPLECGLEVSEWNCRRKDGTYFPALLTVTPTYSEFGEVIGYLGVATDLTKLKETEKSLNASERRFLGAFQGSAVGMAIAGVEGGFQEVNMALCQIFGYRKEELLTMNFKNLTHPDDIAENLDVRRRTLEGKQTGYSLQKRYIHADGHTIWATLTSSLIRDAEGTPLYFLSQIEDITDKHSLEQEVEDISKRLIVATEASEIGIWDWDITNDSIIWDDRTKRLFEVQGDDVRKNHKELHERMIPEDSVRLLKETEAVLKSGNSYNTTFRIRLDNRKIRHIASTSSILRDDSGKAVRMVGTNRDITDAVLQKEQLERLAEEAKSANKSKSEFLANMSHEIRTPLNGIIGMATMLSELGSTTEEQSKYIKVIRDSGKSLLSLISGILDFAKIEAGKVEIEKTEFSLRELLDECLGPYKVKAESEGLKFRSHAAMETPDKFLGDPTRIGQVLVNLCSNAIKFTEKGSIRIFVEAVEQTQTEADIRFSVIDTGIGISEENKKKLFQHFTQADSSTSRQYGGTGLGLAISKQLVGLMGGEIQVKSDIGVGSVFWFQLRLASVQSANQARTSEKDTNKSETEDTFDGSSHKILLVEDNLANQMVMQGLLKKYGFSIDTANNGLEALDALEKSDYDLVFMDVQMPKMDGLEATRKIRSGKSNARNKDIPIIAITAHARMEAKLDCLDAGMNNFVTKPVNRTTLLDAIRIYLRKSLD